MCVCVWTWHVVYGCVLAAALTALRRLFLLLLLLLLLPLTAFWRSLHTRAEGHARKRCSAHLATGGTKRRAKKTRRLCRCRSRCRHRHRHRKCQEVCDGGSLQRGASGEKGNPTAVSVCVCVWGTFHGAKCRNKKSESTPRKPEQFKRKLERKPRRNFGKIGGKMSQGFYICGKFSIEISVNIINKSLEWP